jgi:hypothetical protein
MMIGLLAIIYSIDAIYGLFVYYQIFNMNYVMEEEEYFSHLNSLILDENTNNDKLK